MLKFQCSMKGNEVRAHIEHLNIEHWSLVIFPSPKKETRPFQMVVAICPFPATGIFDMIRVNVTGRNCR